jgi:hypothetical protein
MALFPLPEQGDCPSDEEITVKKTLGAAALGAAAIALAPQASADVDQVINCHLQTQTGPPPPSNLTAERVDVSHPASNVVVTTIHFATALIPPVFLTSGYESGYDISYHFARNNVEFGFVVPEASGFQIGRVFNNDWKHDNQRVDPDANTYAEKTGPNVIQISFDFTKFGFTNASFTPSLMLLSFQAWGTSNQVNFANQECNP